mmetsp:Transcript_33614/g.81025  ORF Transcript_33614/g.81025 Transcript_33614/m.81025 type:complete len:315 (+) Transcript_33614:273-1217(+)|eukprot:CAMPEP_0113470926 /NCGR_PEP_ID=MMETSP0014_2-20120614/16707_1 /TAXON_ID=2857 /ORGANISM="Nitzschia sp." /LENGTH=314 /DNA_ID=CAMNT_0000363531 /DNA_START=230 /DNA_END=1174 /DNA_ORIENTATION=- /assembly_acc=CAM_ASM_000159
MVPRKSNSTTTTKTTSKKNSVVVSHKKKKSSSIVEPISNIRGFHDIAILGERQDNIISILKEDHQFDLASYISKLLKDHPESNIFLYGGTELGSNTESKIPFIGAIVVPQKYGNVTDKVPPQFLKFQARDEKKIIPFSDAKLSWKKVAPRVWILHSSRRVTKTSVRAMSNYDLGYDEYVSLWTIVPKNDLSLLPSGKLDIRAVKFEFKDNNGEVVYEGFNKDLGDVLRDSAQRLAEMYKDGTEDDEAWIKDTIRQAFQDARDAVEEDVNRLERDGYDKELLDAIFTVKIYPVGLDEGEKSNYVNKYYGRARRVL